MSVNWNPLNLKPWQIGLSAGGGAVLLVVIIVLAVLGSQGVFDTAAADGDDASNESDAGATQDASTNTSKIANEPGTGFLMNTAFTIKNVTNTSTGKTSFMAKWLGDYSQVDASSLGIDSISTAWKLADSNGKYMVLKGDTSPRLELATINSSTTSYRARTDVLTAANVINTLPQNIDAGWKSTVAGTNGDILAITYSSTQSST